MGISVCPLGCHPIYIVLFSVSIGANRIFLHGTLFHSLTARDGIYEGQTHEE